MIRTIIVDDDIDAAMALKRNIDGVDVIRVVAVFNNGKEVVDGFSRLHPDVILMDIRMPIMDGIEATRLIKQADKSVKILILTLFSNKFEIIKAMNINCDGYVIKGHKGDELVRIIKNVHKGMNTYESQVQNILHEYVFKEAHSSNDVDRQGLYLLKKRETDIVALLTEGKTNAEIAGELFLSEGYVRNQLVEIREKLGLRNSKELAVWGAKMGL
jgi:DNA-binding NarL/FixJ family response regulator